MNKKTSLTALCAAALMMVSGSLMAEDVYNWRNERGTNTYSDVPRNLRQEGSNIMNVRTQTTRPAVVPAGQQNQLPQIQGNQGEISAADLQAQANQKAQEENKALEEENRRVREENERTKASNCSVAKLNLQHAQTARVENRDQLIQQYQNNVNTYCN